MNANYIRKIISFLMFFFCPLFGIQQTSYGKETFANEPAIPVMKQVTILIPPTGEKAYGIAGDAFADIWEKVTGQRPDVNHMETGSLKLPEGDVILIGSDAVNPVVHDFI
ncbi:MAG: hypothetical protein ABFD02_17880, partial [Bacteroidales bacterium]